MKAQQKAAGNETFLTNSQRNDPNKISSFELPHDPKDHVEMYPVLPASRDMTRKSGRAPMSTVTTLCMFDVNEYNGDGKN